MVLERKGRRGRGRIVRGSFEASALFGASVVSQGLLVLSRQMLFYGFFLLGSLHDCFY